MDFWTDAESNPLQLGWTTTSVDLPREPAQPAMELHHRVVAIGAPAHRGSRHIPTLMTEVNSQALTLR